jgi:hypothetical protein
MILKVDMIIISFRVISGIKVVGTLRVLEVCGVTRDGRIVRVI